EGHAWRAACNQSPRTAPSLNKREVVWRLFAARWSTLTLSANVLLPQLIVSRSIKRYWLPYKNSTVSPPVPSYSKAILLNFPSSPAILSMRHFCRRCFSRLLVWHAGLIFHT